MAELLYSSSYQRPGAYIGQIITPDSGSSISASRIPVVIGKGSRYMLSSNAEIKRAYVYEESIEFTNSSPYIALLRHPAVKDVSRATLVRVSDSFIIPENQWRFQDENSIILSEEYYESDAEYIISYQSTDRSVLDPAPVINIANIRSCGTSRSTNNFVENRDYFLVTSFSDITEKGTLVVAEGVSLDDRYNAISLYPTQREVEVVNSGNGAIKLDVYDLTPISKEIAVNVKVDMAHVSSTVSPSTFSVSAIDTATTLSLVDLGIAVSDVYSLEILTAGWTEVTDAPDADKEYLVNKTGGVVTGITVYVAAPETDVSVSYSHNRVLDGITVTAVLEGVSVPGIVDTVSEYIANDGGSSDTYFGASLSLGSTDGQPLTWESFDASLVNVDDVVFEGTPSEFLFTVLPGKVFTSAKDNRNVTLKYVSAGTSSYNHTISPVTGDYSTGVSASVSDATKLPAVMQRVYPYVASSYGTVVKENGDVLLLVRVDVDYTDEEVTTFVTIPGTVNGSTFTAEATSITCCNNITIAIAGGTEFVVIGELFRFSYACYPVAGTNYKWYYSSDTPEGGFGTLETQFAKGTIVLPGNIIVNVDATDLSVNDEFTFTHTNNDVIDWSLTLRTTEQIQTSKIYRDVNGTKTGIPGSYYVELAGTPINGIKCSTAGIVATLVQGTSYAIVEAIDGSKPQVTITISYEYSGKEPAPASTYYLSTLHIRPDNYYNKVLYVSSREEGNALLGPSTSNNDLYIANTIAWDAIGSSQGRQVAYIQIKDSDSDGVISDFDVREAISALKTSNSVTDWTLLGNFDCLSYILQENEQGNDPFALRENELFVGCPSGTIVGDINTEGSLIHTAKSLLKVYGESPAHGTRILVAPTEATKTILLDNGKAQTITVDGSFVAWAVSVLRSTLKISDSIIRKNLTCFDTIQTFDDVDDLKLGAAQIIYFSRRGKGVYRIEEDFTTDSYSFEFSLEQITSQRLQLVRDIRTYMDENLVGYTPDSPQSGINTVSGFLVRKLTDEVRAGNIAQYQDENGNLREIDPAKDIFVKVVPGESNKYQFGYGFYTKKATKILYGVYVVDRDFLSTGLGV